MRRIAIALLVALLLLLAGCSGPADDTGTPQPGADSPTPTTDNEAGGNPDAPGTATAGGVTPHGANETEAAVAVIGVPSA